MMARLALLWLRRSLPFWRDRHGASAIEFALIAPLLCLMLGVSVEVGRYMNAQREFETAVIGVARHVARYPEFEIRAREYAKPVATTLFPEMDVASFNLIVNGLIKESGVLKEVFPGTVLFGTNPGMPWGNYVKGADYVDDETIIYVGATYNYKPFFPGLNSFPIIFRKEVVILPSFGRHYPWNDGQVDPNKYVY